MVSRRGAWSLAPHRWATVRGKVFPSLAKRVDLAGTAVVLVCVSGACEPKLVVGKVVVKEECEVPGEPDGGAGASSEPLEIPVPWSTGFETGFCDFAQFGYCYDRPGASYAVVSEPVHEGRGAAEFTVTSSPAEPQARCVLRGTMPRDAVYGAWYYVPELAQNNANWNLFHFRSGAPGALPADMHGIWDVSLRNGPDGSLQLYVLGFDRVTRIPDPAPPIPIGAWFRIQFRLKRAADGTGAIALYQDGELLVDEVPAATDDGEFGEWYVGNLATGLMPRVSTIYVDDVSITATP